MTLTIFGDAAIEEDYVAPALGWAVTNNLPIVFICEDNDLSVITKTEDRRSWRAVDLANSLDMYSVDITDDPWLIAYHVKKISQSGKPGFINIRTVRGIWHAGTGVDGDLEWNRYQLVEEELIGMGLSKAKGILWAKKYLKKKGKVIVLTGDGEFQEGQIFEALQTISHQKLNDIIVIIDHNKIQSSEFVKKIIDLKNLKQKIKSFGWFVTKCNGHDFKKLKKTFNNFDKIKNKPKLLIADTIKGKGVSFMEHPRVMKKEKIYNWHSGAPNDKDFNKAQEELVKKIKNKFSKQSLKLPKFNDLSDKNDIKSNKNSMEIH